MSKNSFIIYNDYADSIFCELTYEEIGKLICALIQYSKDGTMETFDDRTVRTAYKRLICDFDRNNEKYERICERNRENGKKGGRPPKTEENPMGYLRTQNNPIKPDNDIDTVSDTDKGNVTDTHTDKDIEYSHKLFERVWYHYPKKINKQQALQVWDELKPNKALAKAMADKIDEFAETKSWQMEDYRYVPQLHVWLSEKRWEDEVPKAREFNY